VVELTVVVPCEFNRNSTSKVPLVLKAIDGKVQVTVPGPTWPIVIPEHDAPPPIVKP